jgi:hypothetical protein
MSSDGVTACLLHNDPASYGHWLVKVLRTEAGGKPSLNRALVARQVNGYRRETL